VTRFNYLHTSDQDAKNAYLATPLTQDELKIIHSTLNDVLHYFTVITMELQNYLNLKLRIREAEDDATTHAARINHREKTTETAVDLEQEPTSTIKDINSVIKKAADKEVAKAIKRQKKDIGRKNSSGTSAAQKREIQNGKGKNSNSGKKKRNKTRNKMNRRRNQNQIQNRNRNRNRNQNLF
jgi:hypothetical protein